MELKGIAIGTLTVLLLVSMGFNVQPEDTHFCRDLELGMQCSRLSQSELTCYPSLVTLKGKKYCSTGWEQMLTIENAPSLAFPQHNSSVSVPSLYCNGREWDVHIRDNNLEKGTIISVKGDDSSWGYLGECI